MGWTHYQDLIVWQKAMDLVDELYRLLGFLPREESYALADQMRRAVISIPSNIAEGHGRQTGKEFKQFLSDPLWLCFFGIGSDDCTATGAILCLYRG